MAELRKKQVAARPVSLVGPGRVGETRFAIRAARELGRGFAGGACWSSRPTSAIRRWLGNAVMAALDLRDQG